MKIGFFTQYNGPESQIHLDLAAKMIESAKSVMPDVEVWHLTDKDTPQVAASDGVIRIDETMPMAVRRLTHHSRLHGDWAFVDSDIVFNKCVKHVFDAPFDVALTDRIGTEMEGTAFAKQMPFNMGVTFSRCPQYWEKAVRYLKSAPADLQEWMGDQHVICQMAQYGHCGFNVRILPGRVYNYPPVSDNEDCSHAAIVHYKGQYRKQLMEAA